MIIPGATTDRIEALRALVDRLDSPDLTLPEAKVLRARLLDLTARADESGVEAGRGCPTAPRPGCRNCAA